MLASSLVDRNPAIGLLQNPYNLAFRKPRFLRLNLQAKSWQKFYFLLVSPKREAYGVTLSLIATAVNM